MVVIFFILMLTGVAFVIQSTDILKKEFKTAKRKRQVSKDVKAAGGMKKKYFYLIERILFCYKDYKILRETDMSIYIGSVAYGESEIFCLSQTIDSKLHITFERKNTTRGQTLSWNFWDNLDQTTMIEIIIKDIEEKINVQSITNN